MERLQPDNVPPSLDSKTGVQSKDVVISAETNVSARLYIPKDSNSDHKLPLIIYFHGGGFISGSPFQEVYHYYLNSIVAEAKVVAVSVDYRLAPENPISTLYDDSWFVLKWVASHYKGGGNETWLKDYVDFERVFFGGESAGGNIVHNMAMRCGSEKLDDVKLLGIFLINPYFFGKERIGQNEAKLPSDVIKSVENLWLIAGRMSIGLDDPRVDPLSDPKLSSLGGSKVLVSIAEKDWLRDRDNQVNYQLIKQPILCSFQVFELKLNWVSCEWHFAAVVGLDNPKGRVEK
ncbi:hypothetical protein F0562_002889 [Nyssa sinensis]|uniref:Alpha/beta hydrolase fold-3 domain-containing protein n=1 Tax=Nyssa sinensis TaxID=561372 RepID=A0A5J5BXL7_9ASTE|nr:hypothetical protein F0562_002889 [Nyssa sinensis]